jgi:hypothetical protein
MENEEILNRVTNSALITFDLEDLYEQGERVLIDIKDQLYEGLILREKDFRTFIRDHSWSDYKGKLIAITCLSDAIIPTWAYMLMTVALQPYAKKIVFGNLDNLERVLYQDALEKVDWEKFKDNKIVVKGCSKVNVPVEAYVEVINKLRPIASSIMYGEACSTVPLFKKPKN